MRKLAAFSLVAMLALYFAFQLPGLASADTGPVSSENDDIHDGMHTLLTAPYAPHAGEVVELVFQVTPYFDASDLKVEWKIEGAAELIGSPVETFPHVSAGQSVSSVRQVRFPEAGDFKVSTMATFHVGSSAYFASPGILWFKIGRYAASVYPADPNVVKPREATGLVTSYKQPGAPTAPDDCITVNGTVTRRDRLYHTTVPQLWGSQPVIPVANALVKLREEDTFFDDTIAEVTTDTNGHYSFTACGLDDGYFDNNLEIYVRLRAELHVGGPSGVEVVEVEDSSWIDETYEYDSEIWYTSPSGTHTFDYHLENDYSWSAIFNIADAIWEARRFWNDSGGAPGSPTFDQWAEVHWEYGYDQDSSKYIGWNMEEISISNAPDPDEYDDHVIQHEWNHFVEEHHYCIDTWGGSHSMTERLDPELAYSEGYGDFYPSALRENRGLQWPSWYLDLKGLGEYGSATNLEDWNTAYPQYVFYNNETSIAAAFWDLIDTPPDGQDNADLAYSQIQALNSWDEWQHQPGIDDHCHIIELARYWQRFGLPTTAGVAGAFNQNIGRTVDFTPLASRQSPDIPDQAAVATEYTYNWWDRIAFLLDDSASMSNDGKFNSVKTVLQQAVDTLTADPDGAEFELWTFNNSSITNQERFSGMFTHDSMHSAIESLSPASGSDSSCYVEGFKALGQMTEVFGNADLWLFTDGFTYTTLPPAHAMTRMLQDKDLRASIALLGSCSSLATTGADEPAAVSEAVKRSYRAAAKNLGITTDGVEEGILPYLVVAAQSGGQFLYVSPTQLDSASEVLLSQITHSAGAGRWSDYVSDYSTYRYDRLASWEYSWVDVTAVGMQWPGMTSDGYVVASLPLAFDYFGVPTSGSVYVYENGYMVLDPAANAGNEKNNTSFPNTAVPNNAIYPFWDELLYMAPGLVQPETSQPGLDGATGSKLNAPTATGEIWEYWGGGDWVIFEYKEFYDLFHAGWNTFEVMINLVTDEIRFQYGTIVGGAQSATIGLENASGASYVQASYNTTSGAQSGMGYKFTPAPAQPTKTYTVAVDSTMSSIGFLMTGFSGDFDPLVVLDSDDKIVTCSDPGVTCISAGRVQYLQAPVNSRYGDWDARVEAGPSGSGTFSFSSFAISAVAIEDTGEHSISTASSLPLYIDLGQTTDDSQLQGDFVKPDGSACGSTIYLYDDGAHNDLYDKDGVFGSAAYTPQCTGSAYLQLTGVMTGTNIVRVDPKPYLFIPVRLEFNDRDVENYGSGTTLSYYIHNDDDFDHTYIYDIQLPPGWWTSPTMAGEEVFVNAHSNKYGSFQVFMGADPNTLASGNSGQVVLTIIEKELGEITASDSATITRRRAPSTLVFEPNAYYLRPYDTVPLLVYINDEQGYPVADGLQIDLYVTPTGMGSLPGYAITANGLISFDYTAGGDLGTVTITAQYNGPLSALKGGPLGTYEIPIQNPEAHTIDLVAADHTLPGFGSAQTWLTATVLDHFGDPVKSVDIEICVLGDQDQYSNPEWGLVDDTWCVTKTTDNLGQVQALYTAGYIHGWAKIGAQVVPTGDAKYQVGSIEDLEQIWLSWYDLYLPCILR